MKHSGMAARLLALIALGAALLIPRPPQAAAQDITIDVLTSDSVPLFDKYEAAIDIGEFSGNPHLPFEPAESRPGTNAIPDGISVDAQILGPGQDDWDNARVQPCFWFQPMAESSLTWGYVPEGQLHFRLRFAPDTVSQTNGDWRWRVRVRSAQGTRYSAERSFTCTPSSHPGYLRVSPSDPRYFEHADGTPFIALGINEPDPGKWNRIAPNFNLLRPWWQASNETYAVASLSGQTVSRKFFMGNDAFGINGGSLTDGPRPQRTIALALEAGAANKGTMIVAEGAKPDTEYEWRALVKLPEGRLPQDPLPRLSCPFVHLGEEVTGPQIEGNPEPSQQWVWVSGRYLHKQGGFYTNWYFSLDQMNPGDVVLLADFSLREVIGSDRGPEMMPFTSPNVHQQYNPYAAWRADKQLEEATRNNQYLKVVAFEKECEAWGSVGEDGWVTGRSEGNFYGTNDPEVVDVNRWYQRAYLRYLAARWGWSPHVHSFEYVNEAEPFNGRHEGGATHFASYLHQVNVRPLLASTSLYHSQPGFWEPYQRLSAELWRGTTCDYVDVHRYDGPEGGTGGGQVYGLLRGDEGGTSGPGSLEWWDQERGYVLKMEGAAQPTNRIYLAPVPVTPGHQYQLSYKVRWNWNPDQDAVTTGPYVNAFGTNQHSKGEVGNPVEDEYPSVPEREEQALAVLANPSLGQWQDRVNQPFSVGADIYFLYISATIQEGTGECWFDNIRLRDLTENKDIPLENQDFASNRHLFDDTVLTALLPHEEYIGGKGGVPRAYQKPWIQGEWGLFTGINYADDEHPDVLRDRLGVWLHKLIWGHVNPSGGTVMLWYSHSTESFHMHQLYQLDSVFTYRDFMADLPLNNGYYEDAQPDCTGTDGLRAFGQKDTTNGRAHLWIDNPQHTWRWAVDPDPQPLTPRSGTIRIGGFAPGGSYRLHWWDTRNGPSPSTEALTATSQGVLLIPVSGVYTDLALKVMPE